MDTMTVKDSKFASYASLLLRIGLGFGFLSAGADRLGLWGTFGQPNVEWGNFSRFLEYTQTLNWYVLGRNDPNARSSPLALKFSSVFSSSSAGIPALPRC